MARLPRVVALAAALLPAAPPCAASDPHEATGLRPTAVPLLNFSSDDGVGYGLRANLYEYDGRTVPYLRKYSAQLFFTSRGRWVHHLSIDTPRFRGGDDRFELVLRFEKEAYANFLGSLTDAEARGLSRGQKTFSRSLPWVEARWIRRLGRRGRRRPRGEWASAADSAAPASPPTPRPGTSCPRPRLPASTAASSAR